MKIFTKSVFFLFILVLIFMNCDRDESDLIRWSNVLLEKEIVNGFETYIYEYDENKLVNYLYLKELFDPIKNVAFIDATEYFDYFDRKVLTIIEEGSRHPFSYSGDDLRITRLSMSDTMSEIIFINYNFPNLSYCHLF